MRSILTGILLIILMAACSRDGGVCISNTGKQTTQQRILASFENIYIYDNIDLIITQDTFNEVIIEGGKNLLAGIETAVDTNWLHIRNNNSCNWLRSYENRITAYVKVKDITSIAYRGSGNVNGTNTLRSDSLVLDIWEGSGSLNLDIECRVSHTALHYGTADLYISGNTNVSFVYSASYGLINCRDLSTVFTYITNKGTNDCYVQSNYTIVAKIESVGNIYYIGDPVTIETNYLGDGRLIKLD